MLNPFPDLLAFALLAPTLLRIVLGIMLILQAKQKTNALPFTQITKAIYFIGGVFLILGAFTQYSAMAISLALLYEIFYTPSSKEKKSINILLLVISISLLFLGAGFFALDLPL